MKNKVTAFIYGCIEVSVEVESEYDLKKLLANPYISEEAGEEFERIDDEAWEEVKKLLPPIMHIDDFYTEYDGVVK